MINGMSGHWCNVCCEQSGNRLMRNQYNSEFDTLVIQRAPGPHGESYCRFQSPLADPLSVASEPGTGMRH